MGLIYFALGCLIVFGLHQLLQVFTRLSPPSQRRVRRGTFWALGVLILLLLLRVGQPYLAALFSGLLASLAFIGRAAPWLLRTIPFLSFLWRKRQRTSQTDSTMTVERAREILGVSEEESDEDVKAAYHRLMQKLHPDAGGNDYLASQINEAKEVLLKQHRETA